MNTMTVYLWFSAGHLAFQSLKWVSYSTDRILRFGQSAANHDCGKYKIRFEFLVWLLKYLRRPVMPYHKLYLGNFDFNFDCFFKKISDLGPAFSVVLSDPFHLVIIHHVKVLLTPCFKSCSQEAVHEENISFDWLAEYTGWKTWIILTKLKTLVYGDNKILFIEILTLIQQENDSKDFHNDAEDFYFS